MAPNCSSRGLMSSVFYGPCVCVIHVNSHRLTHTYIFKDMLRTISSQLASFTYVCVFEMVVGGWVGVM